MNFELGSIIEGMIKPALGAIFGLFKLSGETGNGLLGFVDFFGMIGEFFAKIFRMIFGGIGG